MTPDERKALEAVLGDTKSFVLATIRDGTPWTTAMYVGEEFLEDGRVVFYCAQHLGSRSAAAMQDVAAVAFFMGGNAPTRWVQASGVARLVPEDQHDHAKAVLGVRAPEAAAYVDMAVKQSGGVTFFRIEPQTLEIRDVTADPRVVLNLEQEF